jgi:hypothetical protein
MGSRDITPPTLNFGTERRGVAKWAPIPPAALPQVKDPQ